MKGIKDYLKEGCEVKSSHVDGYGQHWLVLQKDATVVLVKLPVSMWSGKPVTDGKSEECWEISA